MPSHTAILRAPASSSRADAARAVRPRRPRRGGTRIPPPPRARPSRRRRPARRPSRGCLRASRAGTGSRARSAPGRRSRACGARAAGPRRSRSRPRRLRARRRAGGCVDRSRSSRRAGRHGRPRRGSRLASGTMIAKGVPGLCTASRPPLASGSSVAADHLPRVRPARARRRHAGRRARLPAGRGHRPLRRRRSASRGACSTSSAAIA